MNTTTDSTLANVILITAAAFYIITAGMIASAVYMLLSGAVTAVDIALAALLVVAFVYGIGKALHQRKAYNHKTGIK